MKNIQKRLRAFVASAMMLCAILPSFAYSFEVGGIYYNTTGEAEVEVTSGSTEYTGDVVIPSSVSYSGTTYSVTAIGEDAFEDCSGLTSVTIPNSVTRIGTDAFYGCSELKKVHINDLSAWCKIDFTDWVSNPTYYAQKLYLNGKEITNLVIPDDITVIKPYVFWGCSGLTSVNIHNSVTEIGKFAFYYCSGLTSVDIPNSVTTIGHSAFADCTGLTSVTIPNSVTSIGDGAFYNCRGLTSVTIPNSVTSIGDGAFSGCTSLTSVTSLADVPPTCGEEVFLKVDTENCPLYVPIGSKDAYSNADTWKNFRNIVEFNASSSIKNILSNQDN